MQREREVLRALESLNSSYSDIETVDARCMPYVSTPASYQYAPQQSAEDAAKWLIGWKNRQETRHKLLMAEIEARSSRCKGCRARYDYRSVSTIGYFKVASEASLVTFRYDYEYEIEYQYDIEFQTG